MNQIHKRFVYVDPGRGVKRTAGSVEGHDREPGLEWRNLIDPGDCVIYYISGGIGCLHYPVQENFGAHGVPVRKGVARIASG